MAWSSPRSWVTGEVVTAAMLNTHLRDNMLETAVAKATAAGQIPYATGDKALAMLAAGTSGYVLTAQGAGVAPAWAAVPANTSVESVLGSDVLMTVSTTWTDIGPSLSLAAGEWLIMAHATLFSTSPAINVDIRVYDATGGVTLAGSTEYVEGSRYRNIGLACRVVLGGTSTVKLQYFVGAGSTSLQVDSQGSANEQATKLVAVRVA